MNTNINSTTKFTPNDVRDVSKNRLIQALTQESEPEVNEKEKGGKSEGEL